MATQQQIDEQFNLWQQRKSPAAVLLRQIAALEKRILAIPSPPDARREAESAIFVLRLQRSRVRAEMDGPSTQPSPFLAGPIPPTPPARDLAVVRQSALSVFSTGYQ